MIILNFSNVEDLIFYDSSLHKKLSPDFFSIFEQWKLSKRISYLRDMGKRSLLDFLNLIDDENLKILEEHFNNKVVVEKLDYNIVENFKIPLEESNICDTLCNIVGYNYYNTWRDDQFLYITFWR
jgi:hypothetical protein